MCMWFSNFLENVLVSRLNRAHHRTGKEALKLFLAKQHA